MQSLFARIFICLGGFLFAIKAEALVYCITNSVDVHQQAPTGTLAQSGWQQTVIIDCLQAPLGKSNFLGTIIFSNALLTAEHMDEVRLNDTFILESTHVLTSRHAADGSDLAVYFFSPPVTNQTHIARLNIESDVDTNALVVFQGCGAERGEVVTTGTRTNGWMWAAPNWQNCTWGTRRWGINQTFGSADTGLCAVASFDNNNNPDECMLSIGDSGGPGFIKTGSGWKVAMVNYAVDPATFSLSTNPVSRFYASLYDYAGLYYEVANNVWEWVPPETSPQPCLLICSRVSQRLDWLTNTVPGLSFPADLGLAWRVPTNQPSRDEALNGFWMDVLLTNTGPYYARNVTVDLEWAEGVLIKGSSASHGTFTTNSWTLPLIQDGSCATLHVETVVWTDKSRWATNRAVIAVADKPDENTANNEASQPLLLPQTMSTVILFL